MTTTPPDAEELEYIAARDSEGNIRLNNGKGLWIARPDDTLEVVQGWHDRTKQVKFKAQCRAVLNFLVAEEQLKAES